MASEALKYMSVPEKIELTNSSAGYPSSSGDPTYRPMKIPDTITLESSGPPVVSGEVRGGGSSEDGGYRAREAKKTEDARQLQPRAEDVPGEQVIPKMSSERFEAPSSTVAGASTSDLEQRVRTLESKVQRLTETFLSYQRNDMPPGSRGNNKYGFWYVMTFAGWMMVPLIAVFMYQLKK